MYKIDTIDKLCVGSMIVSVEGEKSRETNSTIPNGIYECNVIQEQKDGSYLVEVLMPHSITDSTIYHVGKKDLIKEKL